jgi:hypothetical protein
MAVAGFLLSGRLIDIGRSGAPSIALVGKARYVRRIKINFKLCRRRLANG